MAFEGKVVVHTGQLKIFSVFFIIEERGGRKGNEGGGGCCESCSAGEWVRCV